MHFRYSSKFLIFISILFVLMITIFNVSIKKVSGNNVNNFQIKRGYILDRNREPLVITLENYKAYYILKDNSLFHNYSPILKKYLKSTLNLPKRGVVLLSDNLSFDELEQLKKEENVIIEKNFKREILIPGLQFLIGETFNGYGISGLEKVFDKSLKKGNPVVLTLDINLEKELYRWSKNFSDDGELGAGLFDLRTGELLAYIENSKDKLFNHFYAFSIFGLPDKNLKDFKWPLAEKNLIKIKQKVYINLWYLAKLYMNTFCQNFIIPKLNYTNNKRAFCKPDLKSFKKIKHFYFFDKGIISVYVKNHKMLITVFKFKNKPIVNESDEIAKLNKKLDELAYKIL